MTVQPATTKMLVDYLLEGYWSDTSQQAPTYASGDIKIDLSGLSGPLLDLTRAALSSWEAVADIDFQEVTTGAEIVFDDLHRGAWQGWDYANGVRINVRVNLGQDILFGIRGTEIGGSAFSKAVHEIGHALGLGHAGNYDGGWLKFETDALFRNDSMQMTIMSYFQPGHNPYVSPTTEFTKAVGPMMADILAIQAIFGAPRGGVTAGDTVWGKESTMGPQIDPRFQGQFSGLAGMGMTIYDEGGIDSIDFSDFHLTHMIDLRAGQWSSVYGTKGNLLIMPGTLIENCNAGSGNDLVTGNDLANQIGLGDGDDQAWGNEGDDTIFGGSGADTISGGVGNDRLLGQASSDTLRGNGGADTLDSGDGDDRLLGGDGSDRLLGGKGDDRLEGGDGRDRMEGGAGNDIYVVDLAADVVLEAVGGGTDTVRSALSVALAPNVEKLVLTGAASVHGIGNELNNALTGNGGANVLRGSGGGDVINGGAGSDRLFGDAGNDVLWGAAAADGFYFSQGRDVVRDFANNIDTLWFDDALWGGGARTASHILSYAHLVDSSAVFTFGQHVLTVGSVTTLNVLLDDISVF